MQTALTVLKIHQLAGKNPRKLALIKWAFLFFVLKHCFFRAWNSSSEKQKKQNIFFVAIGLKNTRYNLYVNNSGLHSSHPFDMSSFTSHLYWPQNYRCRLSCPGPEWLGCIAPPTTTQHSFTSIRGRVSKASWPRTHQQRLCGHRMGFSSSFGSYQLTKQTKQVNTVNQTPHFFRIPAFFFVYCAYILQVIASHGSLKTQADVCFSLFLFSAPK